MYHWGWGWGNPPSWYGVDGDVASRPDALLANGAAFLPPSQPQQQVPLSSSRRALSTGELLRPEEEQSLRVVQPGRYSAEERRERIDKYRSKRNHRNFQKKITYACRKTLADSRPRVKGRFARNGADYTEAEAEADHVVQASGIHQSESPPVIDVDADRPTPSAFNDGYPKDSCGTTMQEWWPAMQEALATGIDDLDQHLCDEEMLAAYLGVSSVSLYSPSNSSPSASGQ
ncbi:zinc finger protein CONSTANS-like [Phragmites australis]|uniref:zinc finger protein CONSTANS-like n=1 Tax=Phragmites australis TaxID=29695 RepID=UPI002D791630|nr:zinc finger protein CONSTANS-like [Phragmites australis]